MCFRFPEAVFKAHNPLHGGLQALVDKSEGQRFDSARVGHNEVPHTAQDVQLELRGRELQTEVGALVRAACGQQLLPEDGYQGRAVREPRE